MKNVLLLSFTAALFSLVSCASDPSGELSAIPATETLRPLPTSTSTPSARNVGEASTALVPSDPTATPFVHVVREGDTLLSIALTYGVGLEELVLVNPGIDPQFLSVGTSLRIPGPGGEAVDTLLPTPTPVAIDTPTVRCFEALTGEFRCISRVSNNLQVPIEAISGIIGLYDEQGALLTQKSTDSTFQFLPPSQSMPLSAIFSQKPDDFSYADLQILSAIRVDSEVSRFVPVEVDEWEWNSIDNGAGALVEVQVGLPADIAEGSYRMRILGMAINATDAIVGHRVVELVVVLPDRSEISEEFYILSLGPKIESVEILVEMLPIN